MVIRETGQLLLGLPYPISLPHQSTLVSNLSATKVTTLWLKQPTCFCSDETLLCTGCFGPRLPVARSLKALHVFTYTLSCTCSHIILDLFYPQTKSIYPPPPLFPITGHENNAHCLAIAVNSLAGALFAFYGEQHQKERMKEFLVVRVTYSSKS